MLLVSCLLRYKNQNQNLISSVYWGKNMLEIEIPYNFSFDIFHCSPQCWKGWVKWANPPVLDELLHRDNSWWLQYFLFPLSELSLWTLSVHWLVHISKQIWYKPVKQQLSPVPGITPAYCASVWQERAIDINTFRICIKTSLKEKQAWENVNWCLCISLLLSFKTT